MATSAIMSDFDDASGVPFSAAVGIGNTTVAGNPRPHALSREVLTAAWRNVCSDWCAAMAGKGVSGSNGSKERRVLPLDGDGHAGAPPTRVEFTRLQMLVNDIDERVTRNRHDLDVQFQRLADLQAVVDRLQIAAGKLRAQREARE